MSTTNKLAQVIRKIVREEVRKEVRTLLNERKAPKVTRKAPKTGLKHALGLHNKVERKAPKPRAHKQYTKNATLNAILNETAGEIANGQAPETQEYPTMENQTFNASKAHTFDRASLAAKMGYGDTPTGGTPTIQEMLPKTDVRGGLNRATDVDPGVAKALTRDYSELVKKFKR